MDTYDQMYTQMGSITTDRVRKSVRLSAEEYRSLVKWVNNQPTKVDAALLLDITRGTLNRILIARSGAQDTINKVLKVVLKEEKG